MKDQTRQSTQYFNPGRNTCWLTGFNSAAFSPSERGEKKKKLVRIQYTLPDGEKRHYTGYYTGKQVDAAERYQQEFNAVLPAGSSVEIREAA